MIRKFLERRAAKRLHKGWLFYDQDDRKKAASVAAKYLNHSNPQIAQDAMRLYGLSYYKMKQFDKAIPMLHRLAIASNLKQDYYSLALAQLNHDKKEDAINSFNKIASAHSPQTIYAVSYGEMIYQFGKRLYQMNYYSESIQFLNQLMAFYAGVRTIEEKKLYEKGIPLFLYFSDWVKKLIPLHHSNPQNWLHSASRCLPKEAVKEIEVYFK